MSHTRTIHITSKHAPQFSSLYRSKLSPHTSSGFRCRVLSYLVHIITMTSDCTAYPQSHDTKRAFTTIVTAVKAYLTMESFRYNLSTKCYNNNIASFGPDSLLLLSMTVRIDSPENNSNCKSLKDFSRKKRHHTPFLLSGVSSRSLTRSLILLWRFSLLLEVSQF